MGRGGGAPSSLSAACALSVRVCHCVCGKRVVGRGANNEALDHLDQSLNVEAVYGQVQTRAACSAVFLLEPA